MSLFFQNICKFDTCGLHFANLPDLLQHIEETHISTDPEFNRIQETNQPPYVSLSYIWKVYPQLPSKKAKPIAPPPDSSGPPGSIASHAAGGGKKAPLLSNTGGIRRSGVTFSATQRRNETTPTPPQSTVATDVGDSDDSRTSSPECLSQNVDNETTSRWPNYPTEPKPFGNNQQSGFLCTYPNCSKRYKNYQAAKKHMKESHYGPPAPNVPKTHYCHCGKTFKTLRSLQNHAASAHMNVMNPVGSRMPIKSNTIQVVDAASIGQQGGIRATASPLQVFGTIYTAKNSPNTTTIEVKAAPSQSTSQTNRRWSDKNLLVTELRMIPAAWLFLRTYGRFVVFPVAMVVGFVGYQLESRFGSGAKKLPYMETSVKEERMRRHLDDKPDSFQTLHDRKFVPKSSLETNPVSS